MHRSLLVVAILLFGCLAAAAAETLVENGGMEGLADENGAPPRWEAQVIGTPPQLSVDPAEKHAGTNSIGTPRLCTNGRARFCQLRGDSPVRR